MENGVDSLIVTGSSAGGIDALIAFVSDLPAGLPAAVIIAQHLDPTHKSQLAAILAARGPLPVHVLGERCAIEPGTIYVVPPDRDVVVVDGVAATHVEPRRSPKPSIDLLFRTAAERYAERAIAVVFSGMGNDGLAGARVIKEHGGTVIVQDPATALHPSMPLSVPPTLVDFTAAPHDIPRLIVSLLGAEIPNDQSADQAALKTLLAQLCDRSGIDFSQYKTPTILRRLTRLMVASGCSDLPEYMAFLHAHPEGYQRLLNAFLITVTEFFRDAPLFDELRTSILPRLIAEARLRTGELRIWSAGTSTGEEAYSLAIACAEALSEMGSDVSVRIFATDVEAAAIDFARRGLYSAEALRHVPAVWVEKYFVRVGESFEVGKRIRNMTVFGQHDLGQRAPFPNIDLCSCRNVLIYFTRELQTRALQLFAFSLRDAGVLILGKAESTTALAECFRPINAGLKIFERYGDRILIPPSRIREQAMPAGAARAARAASIALSNASGASFELRASQNDIVGAAVMASSLGVVVVDRRYDIMLLNPAARRLLDMHGVGVGEDLIHLVRSIDSEALRGMIDAALRGEVPPPANLRLTSADEDGAERWLSVTCCSDHSPGARAGTAALIISDVTTAIHERDDLGQRNTDALGQLVLLETKVEDLARRQKALLRANEELTASNGELRTTNEQLLITAEESASANEEIETLNEEMQATNEELETLNEELQATVEELNTTNDELEARGAELERLGENRDRLLLQAERDRTAVLAAVRPAGGALALIDGDGTILYGDDHVVTWMTSAGPRWWEQSAATLGTTTYALETVATNGASSARLVLFTPHIG